MYKVQEVANPAAVGFRWESDGVLHEITWLRKLEGGWMYGVKRDGEWVTTAASGIPRCSSLKSARKRAQEFING